MDRAQQRARQGAQQRTHYINRSAGSSYDDDDNDNRKENDMISDWSDRVGRAAEDADQQFVGMVGGITTAALLVICACIAGGCALITHSEYTAIGFACIGVTTIGAIIFAYYMGKYMTTQWTFRVIEKMTPLEGRAYTRALYAEHNMRLTSFELKRLVTAEWRGMPVAPPPRAIVAAARPEAQE